MWTISERFPYRLRKVFTVAVTSLILATTAQAQSLPVRQTVLLRRGQLIVLQVLTALDSGRSQVGDNISLKLFFPVVVDGQTVLPQDWPVQGRVIAVVPAGKNCKQGKVVWTISPVTTPAGGQVYISLDVTKDKASGHRKHLKIAVKYAAMVPLVVLTLPVLVPLAVGMMTEGRCHGAFGTQDTLPAGAVLSAQISRDSLLSPLP